MLAVTALGLAAQPALAQCAPTAGGFACSGANITGQDIDADDTTVTTAPGFSVDTTAPGEHALSIQGFGHISYIDGNGAALTAGSGQIGLNIQANGDNGATPGAITVVTGGAVTGGDSGIVAINYGTGTTSVTATAQVTGTDSSGIYTENAITASDLTVNAAGVTGGDTGINAANNGTGATSVTATGQVTGIGLNGIWVQNATTTTDLTVSAAGVTGNADGIYAYNDGTGATSVTATGQVSGTNGIGINAWNATTATDLTVNAARATGRDTGILAYNGGTGATSVIATGLITGIEGNGVQAYNGATANGLNVNVVDVTADSFGINISNYGRGATTITTSGQVTGADDTGIYAYNHLATTDMTVNSAGVAGRLYGIKTSNNGTGATTITTSGLVEGGVSAISVQSGGQPIAIVTNGLVRNTSHDSTRLAIEAFGGPVALTNAGGMIGTVDFGVGANIMTNNAAWNTAGGENHFGGGTLTNSVNDTIIGGGNGAVPVQTLFDNLGSFVNHGTLTMANGVAGDVVSQTGGNARFEAGSVLVIDVNALGQADKFITTGSATLAGGTVAIPDVGGVYLSGRQWTILTAAGGVSGTFAAPSEGLPYIDVSLGYDASNVYLGVARNGVAFCLTGFSGNECASASSVELLGQGNTLYDLVASQASAEAAAYVFNQVSGEIHASARGMLLEDSRFVRDAAGDRLRAAFGGTGAARAPVLAYGEGGAELVAADTDRFAIWGHSFGSWGGTGGDGNAAAFDRSIGGFLLGGDVPVGDAWRAGLVSGFSRSSFDVDNLASSGNATSYSFGAYGGGQWGAVSLRAGAAYSWNSIETRRAVAIPGLSEVLSADYDGATAQIFGEASYRIDTAAATFEPFANLAYVNLRTGGFTETGGAAALSQAGSNADTTFTALGIRASDDFALGNINVTAHGMLAWRHAFGEVTPLSTGAFAGGNTFTIAGVPIARDAAVLEAGLDFDIAPMAKLGVSYTGQFGSGVSDNGARLDLNVRF
ncbi:autotransporter domain-containing protein [Agrobacterium tumefaciens]|uniref:autotransporter domain-containing protein n=1 Tax=Agrobacterium tumefaciens TaxID=358 RepID=UPI001575DCD1